MFVWQTINPRSVRYNQHKSGEYQTTKLTFRTGETDKTVQNSNLTRCIDDILSKENHATLKSFPARRREYCYWPIWRVKLTPRRSVIGPGLYISHLGPLSDWLRGVNIHTSSPPLQPRPDPASAHKTLITSGRIESDFYLSQ